MKAEASHLVPVSFAPRADSINIQVQPCWEGIFETSQTTDQFYVIKIKQGFHYTQYPRLRIETYSRRNFNPVHR